MDCIGRYCGWHHNEIPYCLKFSHSGSEPRDQNWIVVLCLMGFHKVAHRMLDIHHLNIVILVLIFVLLLVYCSSFIYMLHGEMVRLVVANR